jgi:hypothetical protein
MCKYRGRILGRKGDKSLKSFYSLVFKVTSVNWFYSPPFLEQKWFETALYTKTSSLKIMPRILNEIVKLYVHEFGFRTYSSIFLSLIFQEEDSESEILPWFDCICFGKGEMVIVTFLCSYYCIASYLTCMKELAEK